MHLAGLVLLLFRVLPYFGSLFALSLLYAVCTVPAFCKLFLTKPSPNNPSEGESEHQEWLQTQRMQSSKFEPKKGNLGEKKANKNKNSFNLDSFLRNIICLKFGGHNCEKRKLWSLSLWLFPGAFCKSLVKLMDIVALAAQVAGIAVPIFIHLLSYGEYRWLVNDQKQVNLFTNTWSSFQQLF